MELRDQFRIVRAGIGYHPVAFDCGRVGDFGHRLWWVHKDPPGTAGMVSAGLLIGGALGNVVDRLLYGAVADFLNMSCCGLSNPYAFNIADIAVFIGAFGLVVYAGPKNAS